MYELSLAKKVEALSALGDFDAFSGSLAPEIQEAFAAYRLKYFFPDVHYPPYTCADGQGSFKSAYSQRCD